MWTTLTSSLLCKYENEESLCFNIFQNMSCYNDCWLTSLGGRLQTPWKEPPKRTPHSINLKHLSHCTWLVNYFWGVLSDLQTELLHSSICSPPSTTCLHQYRYNCIWCSILEGSYYSTAVYLAVYSVRLMNTNKLTFLIKTEGLQRNIMLSTSMFIAKCVPIRQKNCHWKWSYRVLKTKHLYLRQVCVRPVSRSLVAHNPVRKRNSRLQ